MVSVQVFDEAEGRHLLCSGTLVGTEDNPFVLTAKHCIDAAYKTSDLRLFGCGNGTVDLYAEGVDYSSIEISALRRDDFYESYMVPDRDPLTYAEIVDGSLRGFRKDIAVIAVNNTNLPNCSRFAVLGERTQIQRRSLRSRVRQHAGDIQPGR